MGAAFGILAFAVLMLVTGWVLEATGLSGRDRQELTQWILVPLFAIGWIVGAYAAHREHGRAYLVWTPDLRFRPPTMALAVLGVWALAVGWRWLAG